ncbi:MAG TPA: DHH family phosphoesterase, partial [Thermoanaerobaculia bacterium]|nr:DHH family phosphoesterase [Thermoanaerobaculia bacterium]
MSAAPPAPPPAASTPGRDLSEPPSTVSLMACEWELAPADPAAAAVLAREAGVSPALAALLLRRGIRTGDHAGRFLRPDASGLHDPSLLAGAEAAADLLVSTGRRGARVVVFGDYDVDGVTAVAQLRAALFRIGADAAAFIPHRLRDGYGLKPETVRRVLAELRPATIVTVDCGIGAREGVACAREAGVDVIVTDHHLVPDELPEGAIVVNPRQPGCPYPYKELAASAVAMKIA